MTVVACAANIGISNLARGEPSGRGVPTIAVHFPYISNRHSGKLSTSVQ